ncbi:hypothetical protein JRO89_XS02G0274100 [Xanthoceras sorbifolium]|uniref:Chromo domain-containing protein n=1 Tax=Xanthoceras sorbifolium TaxID=99658 RepID=A0ABQ8IH41_9ROSI|nr:hypothetical protein JRO89_XS02G0274100 [Xanthoceras sorbifolium]
MANLDRIEAEHSTAPRTRQGERYANTNEDFSEGLHARFGPTQFEDFFGDLTKLQQVGSVCNYQTQFENLLSKVVSLPQSHQISCFISGLKDTIKVDVLAGRPTSLTSAIGLARLYEVRNTSQRHFTTGGEVKKIDSGTKQATSNNISTPPIRRMSTTELQEHRAKGLCYNCNETFVPGHQCRKLFFIEVCTEEDGGDFIMDEADAIQEDVEAVPEISLHAIAGTSVVKTTRVQGKSGHTSTIVLVDSGSTHNFMSEKLAQKVRIQPKTGEHFKVMVASEKKLSITAELHLTKDEARSLYLQPQTVLDCRIRWQRKEVLIHWHGLSPAEATWEDVTY